MRDAQFRRPVVRVGSRAVIGLKPQWKDRFLAPAWSETPIEDELIEEPAVDWSTVSSMAQRRRPTGRRVTGRAA
ncbi:hypothetical protein [Streptomyces sp. NPDC057094]|uniref:hypothetical protein n=1 Tax=Streptomyces sp. NPDC057094 TaxID=3346018 RepID=UPI003624FA9B